MSRFKILLIILFLTDCGSGDGPHKSVVSPVGEPARQSPSESGAGVNDVHYGQVTPIFARVCAACHPAVAMPDWLDYQQAREVALSGELEKRVVILRSMPPPGSSQSEEISDAERALIGRWIKGGARAQEPAR